MENRSKPILRWEERTLEETLSNSMCRVGLTRTREAVEVVEEATPMAGEVEEVVVIRTVMVMAMVIPVDTVTQGATTTTEEGDVVVVVEEEMAIHTTTTKTLRLLRLRIFSLWLLGAISFFSVSAI